MYVSHIHLFIFSTFVLFFLVFFFFFLSSGFASADSCIYYIMCIWEAKKKKNTHTQMFVENSIFFLFDSFRNLSRLLSSKRNKGGERGGGGVLIGYKM